MQPSEPEKETLPADQANSTATPGASAANGGEALAAGDMTTPEPGLAADPEMPAVSARSSAASGPRSQDQDAARNKAPEVPAASIADIQSSGGPHTWTPSLVSHRPEDGAADTSAPAGSRFGRFALLAASLALAACIGAAGGAAGVAGISSWMTPPPQPAAAVPRPRPDGEIKAMRDSVAQLRGQLRSLSEQVGSLKTSSEAAGKTAQAQFAKLADTIDRLEKSQAEPLARLAKMAATVERLEKRDASAAPASDVTGSVRPAPPNPPQPPVQDSRASRAVVPGWRLHEVQHGVALVEGRIGLAEVMVGDTLRGVGRVQDIRREDGRWIVVTSRGVILPAR